MATKARRPKLYLYRFSWTNPKMGIKALNGVIHYEIYKQVIVAKNKKEAVAMFEKSENKWKETLTKSSSFKNLPKRKLRARLAKMTAKSGPVIQRFKIEEGTLI